MTSNPESRKLRGGKDIAQWIHTRGEEVRAETITESWNTDGMNVQDIEMV